MDLMTLVPNISSEDLEQQYVLHTKRNCNVQSDGDDIENIIKGHGIASRARQWFIRKCILSRTHPYVQTYLKSDAVIRYEISKHIQFYPNMIHPMSQFRHCWEWVQVCFTLIVLIVMPILDTFYYNKHEAWFPVVLTIDVVFFCDIILWFFTGYFDFRTKTVSMDPKIATAKYLKGFFALDLLSLFSAELVDLFLLGHEGSHKYTVVLNFLIIVRIRNVLHYTRNIRETHQITVKVYTILEMSIMIIITLHWAACLQYYIPNIVIANTALENRQKTSWIYSASMKKRDTVLKKYILCLSRATIALLGSTHYLDVKTPEDISLNIILTFIGKIGYIYLLVQITHLTSAYSTNKHHFQLMQQLEEYMRYKKLPRNTQSRLRVYSNYCNTRNFDREKNILLQVPQTLKQELVLYNNATMLTNVELLKFLPKAVIIQIATHLRPQIYLANDVIVEANTPGEELFFIVSGTVAVYTSSGKEVCHLEEGAYFGEIALVTDTETRIANVIAIETCEICILSRNDFQNCIAVYPYLLHRLQKSALQRMEVSLLLEEAYNQNGASVASVNISNIRRKSKIQK